MGHDLDTLSQSLASILIKQEKMLCLAESCTGGMLSELLTRIPGSSAWFDRAFITYSNSAKQELLGVNLENIAKFGAVSEQIAEEMALGALRNSQADYSISITGIAGPTGGSEDKPVGTVCIGISSKQRCFCLTMQFTGNRQEIRQKSCYSALEAIINFIEKTDT